MRRTAGVRSLTGVALATAIVVLGLSGCGPAAGGAAGDSGTDAVETTELGWEGQALEALGFSVEDLGPQTAAGDPAPDASAGTNRDGRRLARFKRLRFGFGKRTLHAEAVVQTDEGTKTVVVQRGTVTAIDDTTVTVRSTDGFTLTWTFGDPIRVVERRTMVQPHDIAVGTQLGLVGVKDGDRTVARLIVVPVAANK